VVLAVGGFWGGEKGLEKYQDLTMVTDSRVAPIRVQDQWTPSQLTPKPRNLRAETPEVGPWGRTLYSRRESAWRTWDPTHAELPMKLHS
jgi:hypothetical protein